MSGKTTILALNGVHTAGKSTIGERLEEDLDVNYHSEIAQELIDEEGADWGDEGDYAFQEAIHQRESKRDRNILRNGQDHAVIETWHTGNMAHSEETAPSLVDSQQEYFELLEERSDVEVYAVFLDMPLELIWHRSPHFEEGDEDIIDFYDDVRDNHFEIYERHDVDFLVVENDGSLDEAYEQVVEFTKQVL